jgi:CheY-like chemotaxis protein
MSKADHQSAIAHEGSPAINTVLVVDDDIIISMNTAALLEELGHRALEANGGAEALDLLVANPAVTLLVTDQAMPGLRGSELIAEARKIRPDLRVILATGYDGLPGERPENVVRLDKPFGLAELENAVGTALGTQVSMKPI